MNLKKNEYVGKSNIDKIGSYVTLCNPVCLFFFITHEFYNLPVGGINAGIHSIIMVIL